MDYRVDDKELNAPAFLTFVNQIWPGSPDTGDVNNLRYWFFMLLTSVAAALRMILRKRPYNRYII